jgi:hypothetical protein
MQPAPNARYGFAHVADDRSAHHELRILRLQNLLSSVELKVTFNLGAG